MFRRMHLAIDTKNLLRPRNAHVIDELMAEVSEAGPPSRPGKGRHQGAAGAAVEIEAQRRPEPPHSADGGRENLIDIGIALEDLAKAILRGDRDAQIGTEAFQDGKRG